MKIVRTTVVKPRAGFETRTAAILRELDEHLALQPGFLESYEVVEEPGQLGRIALWESREAADRAAKLDRTIALRARPHNPNASRRADPPPAATPAPPSAPPGPAQVPSARPPRRDHTLPFGAPAGLVGLWIVDPQVPQAQRQQDTPGHPRAVFVCLFFGVGHRVLLLRFLGSR